MPGVGLGSFDRPALGHLKGLRGICQRRQFPGFISCPFQGRIAQENLVYRIAGRVEYLKRTADAVVRLCFQWDGKMRKSMSSANTIAA